MNPQLSYRMAQFHQQDLHRQAEQARAARELSGPSRFSALRQKISNLELGYRKTRPQTRPVARGAGEI